MINSEKQVSLEIILTNIVKQKKFVFKRADFRKKIRMLTTYEIYEIIQLYEPTCNLNKIIIQAKINNGWVYLTSKFYVDLNYYTFPELYVRYKFHEIPFINQTEISRIKEKRSICEGILRDYGTKYDNFNADINIFWASPCITKGINQDGSKRRTENVPWKLCSQSVVRSIGKSVKKSNKRVYLSLNSFNKDCFKLNEYSIVYLLCFAESFVNKRGVFKRYFVGEERNGELKELGSKQIIQMLKQKTIQLLILHTSYPFFHLSQISKKPNIKNILLIKDSPVYCSDSTSYFLAKFFTHILEQMYLKDAYAQALKELKQKFPKDQFCCCYHDHKVQCKFHPQQYLYGKYTNEHYFNHKLNKVEGSCCCPPNQGNFNHSSEQKYKFEKKQDNFDKKKFQFENGQPKGDLIYLKAFEAKQSVIGNSQIFPALLKAFTAQKKQNLSTIVNIHNKMCGDKVIFVQNLTNFLIRRKIFIQNCICQPSYIDSLELNQNNSNILYTFFLNDNDANVLKKLQSLGLNILIISQQKLSLQSMTPVNIRPLEQKQCMNYIKAQKHLSLSMKARVKAFFEKTCDKQFAFIYYPANFDYNGLMNIIANTTYPDKDKDEEFKAFQNALGILNKDKLLFDYIIFTIFTNQKSIKGESLLFSKCIIYRKLTTINPKLRSYDQLLRLSRKYYHYVLQYLFKTIQPLMIRILRALVRITFCEENQEIALYNATTVSNYSFLSTFFPKTIKNSLNVAIDQKLLDYLLRIKKEQLIKAGLNFVNNVLTCFYLYDVLEFDPDCYRKNIQRNKKYKEEKFQKIGKQYRPKATQYIKLEERPKEEQEQQLQKNRISQAEILCLLVINNAIVYRKYSKLDGKNSNQHEIQSDDDQQFQGSLTNIYRLSSLSTSVPSSLIGSKTSIQRDSQIFEADVEGPEADINDPKIYQQSDFKIKNNYLTRNGLLCLLEKLNRKKPIPKIAAVSNGLILQLAIQFHSKARNFHQIAPLMSLNPLSFNQRVSLAQRSLVAYNMILFNIQASTKCGRIKLRTQTIDFIQKQCKELGFMESRDCIKNSLSNNVLNILQILVPTKEDYLRLKNNLQILSALSHKLMKQQPLIKAYQQIALYWQQFNFYSENIKKRLKHNISYNGLFKIKNETEKILLSINKEVKTSVYLFDLLIDLDKKLAQKLEELGKRLFIFLINNQNQGNYIVDYYSLLQKWEFEISESENFFHGVPLKDEPVRAILQLNENNVKRLKQRGGCKMIAIISKRQGQKKKESQIGCFVIKQLLNLNPTHVFLCMSRNLELQKAFNSVATYNPFIVYYDFGKLYSNGFKCGQIVGAVKSALMVHLSIIINQSYIKKQILDGPLPGPLKRKNSQQYINNRAFPLQELKCIVQGIETDKILPQKGSWCIQIDSAQIIDSPYLSLIKNILQIDPIKPNWNRKPQKTEPKLNFQTFISNFKMYMNQLKHFKYIFEFEDQIETQQIQFVEQILTEKFEDFISIHNSNERMVIMLKNYFERKEDNWIMKIINDLFFNADKTKLKTRLIKIGEKTCLIGIRD